MDEAPPPNEDARAEWQAERTTFQRIYDVLAGTTEPQSVRTFAERAACSETGARAALEQLVEMGIAERRETRPVTYRRNDAYFTWKRVEALAREHSAGELRERVEELIAEDEAFQERFGVPAPDAVTAADLPVDDHEAFHGAWAALNDWRTVRRDIAVLRRAARRADSRADDRVQA